MKVGVDLIEIERIRRALERHGDSFKARCFTEAERAYCDRKPNPAQHYAGRFAANSVSFSSLKLISYSEGSKRSHLTTAGV